MLVNIYSYRAKAFLVIIQAAAGSDEAVECNDSRPDCNQLLPTPVASNCFRPKHIQYLVLPSLISEETKRFRYRIDCEGCDGLLQAARQLLLSSHPRLPSPALPMRHRRATVQNHLSVICFVFRRLYLRIRLVSDERNSQPQHRRTGARLQSPGSCLPALANEECCHG